MRKTTETYGMYDTCAHIKSLRVFFFNFAFLFNHMQICVFLSGDLDTKNGIKSTKCHQQILKQIELRFVVVLLYRKCVDTRPVLFMISAFFSLWFSQANLI